MKFTVLMYGPKVHSFIHLSLSLLSFLSPSIIPSFLSLSPGSGIVLRVRGGETSQVGRTKMN